MGMLLESVQLEHFAEYLEVQIHLQDGFFKRRFITDTYTNLFKVEMGQ